MAIRHVMTFPQRRQQPMIFNKTYVVNQQCTHVKNGNGALWGGLLGGLLLGVGNMFMNRSVDLGGQNPYAYLNNMGKEPAQPTKNNDLQILQKFYGDNYIIEEREGKFYAMPKDGGAIIEGNDFNDMLDKLQNPKPKPTGTTDGTPETTTITDTGEEEDGKGALKEYGIEPEYGNKTLDIKKGYTWFNIVSAKYDIPEGVSTKDVALALAAANSGAEGADAMKLAREGVFFKVGDLVDLPESLNVNGQEISLKADHENQAVTPDDYGFVKATHWSATVTQVGDKWFVTENDNRIGEAFDSKAEAEAERDRLNAAQNEE